MSKRTPGVWSARQINQYGDYEVISPDTNGVDGHTVASMIDGVERHPGRAEANALLMAAAPLLLECLENLEHCVAGGIVHKWTKSHREDMTECRQQAMVAIAKAKGGEK
jgi:hypothetical protein